MYIHEREKYFRDSRLVLQRINVKQKPRDLRVISKPVTSFAWDRRNGWKRDTIRNNVFPFHPNLILSKYSLLSFPFLFSILPITFDINTRE